MNNIVSEVANCLELEIGNSQLLSDGQLAALRALLRFDSFVEPPRITPSNLLLFGPAEAEVIWQRLQMPVIARVELPQHKIWLFAFQYLNHPQLKLILRTPAEGAIA